MTLIETATAAAAAAITYEFDTVEYVKVVTHHDVLVPAGFKVVKFNSSYLGSDHGNDIEWILAVPFDCNIKLDLHHFDVDSNFSEEASKLPEGSLVLDGDKFVLLTDGWL